MHERNSPFDGGKVMWRKRPGGVWASRSTWFRCLTHRGVQPAFCPPPAQHRPPRGNFGTPAAPPSRVPPTQRAQRTGVTPGNLPDNQAMLKALTGLLPEAVWEQVNRSLTPVAPKSPHIGRNSSWIFGTNWISWTPVSKNKRDWLLVQKNSMTWHRRNICSPGKRKTIWQLAYSFSHSLGSS